MKYKLEEYLKLMSNPKFVRNAGLAGHIDHGKTSASDCLLAYCGIVAPDLAGQVRYLDFLDMEQRRGITIKTAAITLLVELENDVKYILNLVDTPGHVDFSGKVSRALRLMDGVIIVVDAVEGIMAQTEAYLRLALEEHVRPILYINKIDRLISELSMSPYQIQNRLEEIIVNFNELIDTFGVDYQKREWKVNPMDETVIFGCALGCWGFTIPEVLNKGIKFNDIMELFKKNPKNLAKMFPLGRVFAKIIFNKIPNPQEAQARRLDFLWVNKEQVPKFLKNCLSDVTTVFYISKTLLEAGRIFSVGRVFSGKLTRREYLCLNDGKIRRIDALHILFGSTSKVVREIPAGNIFGAFIDARPGHTYATEYVHGHFKLPSYIAVPVVFIAIEPKRAEDFEKLMRELEIIKIEDPNISIEINKETGEILLGGIGELHLEIVIKELEKRLAIYYSEPMIAYREILVVGAEIEEKGIKINVEPVSDERELREILAGKALYAKDGNILVIKGFSRDEKDAIELIVLSALKNGPLIGEPIIGAKILIEKIATEDESINLNDILTGLSNVMSNAKTEICEPYYEFEFTTKPDYVGTLISEINRRGGKVNSMEASTGGLIKVKGLIPVRSSLGLSSALRSLAHGSAFIQLRFYNYLIATGKAKEYILREIRARKGLD